MTRPLVTAKKLMAQSRARGEIEIPAGALLTPAARDWLQSTRIPVRRIERDPRTVEPAATVCVVGDDRNAKVRALLPPLERRCGAVEFLSCQGHRDGLLEALGRMCETLGSGSKRRGVVIVCEGAIVTCVANKYAGVRAAIAARASSVMALTRELGVNLLVLEHERLSLRQMQAMIETFLAGRAAMDPVVESAIARATGVREGSERPVASDVAAAGGC